MTKYLSIDELEVDTQQGVPVSWIGEDGDALAFTDDPEAGVAAILAMAQRDLGGESVITGDVTTHWMRFHHPAGYHSDEWQGEKCAKTDEGAIRVVRATWVGLLADAPVSS